MEKTKYRDLIMRYLTALDPNQVITTEQVAQYVAEQLQLETATVKKTVNVNMARLEKEGQIVRLTKGIYCRKVKQHLDTIPRIKKRFFVSNFFAMKTK